MIFQLIERNFAATIIAVFLILFIFTTNNFEKRTNRLFLAAAFCILILIIEEAWEVQLSLAAVYVPLRTLLSAIGYTLRPIVPYFLILISRKYEKNKFTIITLPIICNLLVAFSSLFCKAAFWYTPGNEFARGPLGLMPFFTAGFYVLLLVVHSVQDLRKGSFKEALIISAIVLLIILTTIMESVLGFRFIQTSCMATSLTFYYLFLHSNQSNRDSLTGALTRRRFYLDADKYRSALTAVISLDLNDLKGLNDQYGHVAGDKALITVFYVIKKYMGLHASLYRIGGDEFMILCYKMAEDDIQKMIASIHYDLKKTNYQCAVGYALCSPHMSFDSVCQKADNKMYANKQQMKEAARL